MTDTEKKFVELLTQFNDFHNENYINELANTESAMVNNFSFHKDEVAHAIAVDENAKHNFLALASAWVKKLSDMYDADCYDDRNQLSCLTGYCLAYNLSYQKKRIPDIPGTNSFTERIARDHRTLQQTFSALVFCFIAFVYPDITLKGCSKVGYKGEQYKFDEYWWDMPLV